MRALLGIVLSLVVLSVTAPASAGAPCSVPHCQMLGSCTGPADAQCLACESGYWLSEAGPADTCEACSPVAFCTSDLTCSTASNSICTSCQFGHYRDGSIPNTCPACTPVDSCLVAGGCTSATTSQCTICASGHYLVDGPADSCPTCSAVDHCVGDLTCSTGANSRCTQCESGYWLDNSGPASVCRACTAVSGCVSALTCTTASNSVCTACESPGRYLSASGTTCPTCTSIPFCLTSPLSCASANTSRCDVCAAGRYLDTSARPTGADACSACPAIQHCVDATPTCSSVGDSQCTTCEDGYYLDESGQADTCTPCAPVPGCVGQVTCTNGTDSRCTACASGQYLNPGTGQCQACTAVSQCSGSVTCSTASNSVCTACNSGYWRSTTVPTVCTQCTSVANCVSALTCSSAANSVCTACASGYFRNAAGTACPACTAVPHCVSALTCTTAAGSTCTQCESGYVLLPGPTSQCAEQCTAADCSDHGTPAANGYRPSNCGCVCDAGWEGPDCGTAVVEPTPTTVEATPTPIEPTPEATPTPVATPAPASLSPFLCYETQQRALNRAGVMLDDGAGPSTVTVKRAKRLCAPANPQVMDPPAADLAKLTAYTMKQTSPRFVRQKDVTVTPDDPVFPPIVVDLVRPERLLVPAATILPPASSIDHYACVRVKGARSRLSGVALRTQFGPATVDVKRPLHLCTAVDKNGEGVVDPSRDLMCYQVRMRPLGQPATATTTTNQFETATIDLFGVRELCVPAQ